MLASLLTSLALAASELPELDRPVLGAEYAKGKGGGGKASNKQQSAWRTEPYLEPAAGVRLYSQNGESNAVATLGGQAGMLYRGPARPVPQWRGDARVQAEFLAGAASADGIDTSQSMELRAGNFIGPHWKVVGVESGLDLLWNQWTYGGQELAPSWGVEVPLFLRLHQKGLTGYLGVAAAYMDTESRRVDWSEQSVPGFGHEFAYLAGAGGRVAGVNLGLQAEYRVTAAGPITSAFASAQVDGTTINDIFGSDLPTIGGGDDEGGADKGGGRK